MNDNDKAIAELERRALAAEERVAELEKKLAESDAPMLTMALPPGYTLFFDQRHGFQASHGVSGWWLTRDAAVAAAWRLYNAEMLKKEAETQDAVDSAVAKYRAGGG